MLAVHVDGEKAAKTKPAPTPCWPDADLRISLENAHSLAIHIVHYEN